MLQRRTEPVTLITRGYLIAVEAELDVKSEKIEDRLADSLSFMEGVGKVQVDPLGIIEDVVDE